VFLLPTREKPGLDGGKGGGSLVALRGNGRATSDISKTLSDISKATVSSRTAFAIDTKRRIHYSITQPVPFEVRSTHALFRNRFSPPPALAPPSPRGYQQVAPHNASMRLNRPALLLTMATADRHGQTRQS